MEKKMPTFPVHSLSPFSHEETRYEDHNQYQQLVIGFYCIDSKSAIWRYNNHENKWTMIHDGMPNAFEDRDRFQEALKLLRSKIDSYSNIIGNADYLIKIIDKADPPKE